MTVPWPSPVSAQPAEPGGWDLDFGALDSYSARVWLRPRPEWEVQLSKGRLKDPEELGHGSIVRSTASAFWLKPNGENFSAVTAAYGRHNGEDADRGALLLEATRRSGRYSSYGRRVEFVEVETGVLLDDRTVGHDVKDMVAALTIGVVRELPRWRKLESGIGAAATVYRVPDRLTSTYGERPVAFQVFFRLRPAPGAMGRMWNMHMIKPTHPPVTDPHAGHQMP